MRPSFALLGIILVIGLTACSSSGQEKAKQQTRDAGHEVAEGAKKADQEITKEAKDLSSKVQAAVGPERQDPAGHAQVALSHAALLAKVKTKVASDAGLTTLTDVDVHLAGSVVTLTGTVANEDQKKAAETAAAQVEGVTQVRNQIVVGSH